MQLIIFLLIYPILWVISIFPFRLLYIFSDCIYFLVYNIVGYRKKVVRKNIAMALPYLSESEQLIIEKKFYSHMCDMFLEMIKTMSISQEEINNRFKFSNLEVYLDLEKKGKSIALVCAHYASYEWVLSMNKYINFKGFGIYKKIENEYFDKLVRDIRSKFKAYLITTKETKSCIEENKRNGILSVYGFASDQTPRWSNNLYWHHFMGIETPIHTGAESLAKRYDMNVLFLRTRKIKRGFYEASFEVMTENIDAIPDFKLSEDFMAKVEQQIHEQPEYYLWTHKRWKHKKKV